MITAAKFFLWLLSLLPGPAPYAMAHWLAPLWSKLSPGKRHVAEINLQRCFPEQTPEERKRWVHESFIHYICTVLETGRNWYWNVDRLYGLCDEVVNEELFLNALHSKKGMILMAPHWGAWEYLGIFLQRYPDFAILYKPPANPDLEKALLKARKRAGGILLAANAAGLRKLYAHVKAGHAAGVLPDQQPSLGQGRFVPFYGNPALTAVFSARVVKKTGCDVIFSVCERLPGGRYRVHMLPAEAAVSSEDLDEALTAVNRGVEQCVAVDPVQYLWSYKRFRAQPEGQPSFYSQEDSEPS